jgi:hypothetical protein
MKSTVSANSDLPLSVDRSNALMLAQLISEAISLVIYLDNNPKISLFYSMWKANSKGQCSEPLAMFSFIMNSHISGSNGFFKGFYFKSLPFCIVLVNKFSSCSTVDKPEGFGRFVCFCFFHRDRNR